MFFKRKPKNKLAPFTTRLTFLRETLFLNLFNDVWYETFPKIPTGLKKTVLCYGKYRVKHLISSHDHNNSLVVHETNGKFLGTLILRDDDFLVVNAETHDDIETLISALEYCAELDTRQREGNGLPTNADLTNVTFLKR